MKKLIIALVVLFLGYFMFTQPAALANIAQTGGASLWDGATEVFSALIRFLKQLF